MVDKNPMGNHIYSYNIYFVCVLWPYHSVAVDHKYCCSQVERMTEEKEATHTY